MDQSNLFGIPKNQKNYIVRKLDSFQLSLLQGALHVVYQYGLQS